MESIIEFLKNNYDWLFSGILSSLIFFFLGQKVGYEKAINQKQKIGNNGVGIQVGGDYLTNSKKEGEKNE